ADPFFKQSTEANDLKEEMSTTTRLNLHDGLSGCLVYVSAAYTVLRKDVYKQAAVKVAKFIVDEISAGKAQCTNIGGSYGYGSVVYGLAFAGVCIDNSNLIRDAYTVSEKITDDLIQTDKHLDIVNGRAGC